MGAAGALAGAYAWYYLRRTATARFGMTNAVAGVLEDAVAVGAGRVMLRR